MSPNQSLAVGIRLFSIWLLWYGLTRSSSTYFSARDAGEQTSPLPFLVVAILTAVTCVLLWRFALYLAGKILPKQIVEKVAASTFDDWFSVGCSLLGVWALSKAIPALGSYFIVN